MGDEEREIRDLERKILSVENLVLVKVTSLEGSIKTMETEITKLVTIERFNPVSYIAYGLAAGVLTTALGAVLSKAFIP
jgi:hypothetical protein